MEENNKHEKREICAHCQKHKILRWLLALIILIAVFSLGFKLGEFKGAFYGNGFGLYGKGGYMRSFGTMMNNRNFGGNNMMRGYQGYPPFFQQQLQQPSATTPQK